jgi:hypothetical protein
MKFGCLQDGFLGQIHEHLGICVMDSDRHGSVTISLLDNHLMEAIAFLESVPNSVANSEIVIYC